MNYTGPNRYLSFEDHKVYDPGGNNNGVLDPGETADLTCLLRNYGGVNFNNLSTTISCASPYVTITDNAGYFGFVAIDSTKENTGDPYRASASASTPYGTEVTFTLIAVDGSFVDTFDFNMSIGKSAPTDTGLYYAYYSGGPHAQCPIFSWYAIDSTQTAHPGTSLNLSDDQNVTVTLPFTYRYYGINYTQVTISSNGFVAMGVETDYDYTNTGIPNVDGPEAMIAGIWDDLNPGVVGTAGDVYYYYDAAAHRFIVEYFRVEHYASGYPETFEIILYDPVFYPTPTGDGEIIVQYLLALQQDDNTLGIENSIETIGVQYYVDGIYHQLAAPITNTFAIKYTPYPPSYNPGVEEYRADGIKHRIAFTRSVINDGNCVIKYSLSKEVPVQISVYDASGRQVITKDYGNLHGNGGINLRLASLAAGVYFMKVNAGDFVHKNKFILIH